MVLFLYMWWWFQHLYNGIHWYGDYYIHNYYNTLQVEAEMTTQSLREIVIGLEGRVRELELQLREKVRRGFEVCLLPTLSMPYMLLSTLDPLRCECPISDHING